ncbi:MAG: Asp-tRNA(Asn)/Glu-tRNA(Gln) amidotransferase subunit GatA [Planctomycetota bacterium]
MRDTVTQLRDAIRAGEVSAVEAIDDALAQFQRTQPQIDALSQIFADEARARARDVDARLSAGEDVGPLAGVPYTVKDNIATKLGRTTAGSKIIEDFRSPFDATVVRRLDDAGAILIGKTNLDEFGMGSSTENSAYNVTKNPWKTSHVPGGSSGGAAALSAATRGMIHLGSDTGGSIRQPASYCGVCGFKPTYGRVSRYGLLAFASSLDQIGPMQRDARDCALVLETIAGRDTRDSTSRDADVKAYVDETKKGIQGLRIGVPKEYFPDGIDPEVRESVEKGIEALRAAGADVKEISLPHTQYANPAYVLISGAEASSNLARYDGVHYGKSVRDAGDLVEMYFRSRGEGFGAEVKRRIMIGTFVLSSGYYDAYYLTALKVRSLIRKDFENAFEEVDAIVGPTSPVTAFPIGDRVVDPLALYAVDILTVTANLASVPGVSIPCGTNDEGLPIGMQIYGRPLEDDVVLRLASAYQESTAFHSDWPPVSWREGGV